MYDILTIRLPTGAEAPGLAVIDEVARGHGMSRSQWVRALIVRELKTLGRAPAGEEDAALRRYADAETSAALFDRHREFDKNHTSTRDARSRAPAPVKPRSTRIRIGIDADEALALEAAGEPYGMTITQVGATILRRWIGLNKRPPSPVHNALSGIRAEIRRIGVNVNQLAHAANALLADPRLRRQEVLLDSLEDLAALKSALDKAMTDINREMGLDRAHWGITDQRPADNLELLAHPAVPAEFSDSDPP